MAEGVEKTHVYSSVSASATAAGGLPGHVRSYSPASVLECNSPMAFPDHPHQQHMVSHPQSSAATPTASASVVSAGSGLVRQEVELQEEVPAPQSEVARREFAEEEDCDALKSQCSKRRKTVQSKKVIYVPIGPSDGRQKNDGPPSDMWAWRKYGQKPIKGSPYPRGYYRCSSSKGCGARKQVERSCTDPTMLIITYTSEHNHPWPLNRSSNNNSNTNNINNNNSCCTSNSNSATTISPRQQQFHKESSFSEQEDSQFGKEGPLSEEEHRVAEEKMVRSRNPVAETEQRGDAYPCNSPAESLFSLLVSSSSSPLETMVSDMGGFEQLQSSESGGREAAEPNVCSRREEQEEEEDFYADLGELPESASVFSRGSSFFEVDEDSKNSNSNCVSGMDHRSGLLSWPPGG